MIKSILAALAVLFAVSGPAFASIVTLTDQNVVFQDEGAPAPEEPSTEGGGEESGGGGD